MRQLMEPWHCLMLFNFIKKHKIKTVVETGIYHGMSSNFILGALPPEGSLISIEPVIRPDIIPNTDNPRWTIIEGTSTDKLADVLKKAGEIDFFFHDSLHEYEIMMFEYKLALNYAKFIGSHDINHGASRGVWYEFAKEHLEIIDTTEKLGIGRVK